MRLFLTTVLLLLTSVAFSDGLSFLKEELSEEDYRAYRDRAVSGEVGSLEGPEAYLRPHQRAALIVRRGQQQLILQSSFPGDLSDFSWVVPLPARPEVDPVDERFFDYLIAFSEELLGLPLPGLPVYTNVSGVIERESYGGGDVKVIERKPVGVYEATVLEASKPESLRNWLNQNGYFLPRSALEALDYYVQKKWFWVALRIPPERRSPGVAEKLAQGRLMPVRFTFEADEVTYPMMLTASQGEATRVALYLIGNDYFQVPGFTYYGLNRIDRVDPARWSGLAGLLRPGDRLSVLYATIEHEGLEQDPQASRASVGDPAPYYQPPSHSRINPAMVLLAVLVTFLVPLGKWRWVGVGLLLVSSLAAPFFLDRQAHKTVRECQANLKSLGNALELYSTDFSGLYPPEPERLVPSYLKTLPRCTTSRRKPYFYAVAAAPDAYTLACQGDHMLAGIPQLKEGLYREPHSAEETLKLWHQRIKRGYPCPSDPE